MNDPYLLGRRAAASPHWRWLAGSLDASSCARVRLVHPDRIYWGLDEVGTPLTAQRDLGRWPDFLDAATRGCLLQLVREAVGPCHTEMVGIRPRNGAHNMPAPQWRVTHWHPRTESNLFGTEVEALVDTLCAAPPPKEKRETP